MLIQVTLQSPRLATFVDYCRCFVFLILRCALRFGGGGDWDLLTAGDIRVWYMLFTDRNVILLSDVEEKLLRFIAHRFMELRSSCGARS